MLLTSLELLLNLQILHSGFVLRVLSLPLQVLQHVLVVPQIGLGADQDDGNVGCVVLELRVPLGFDVVKGRGTYDGVADDEHIGLETNHDNEHQCVVAAEGATAKHPTTSDKAVRGNNQPEGKRGVADDRNPPVRRYPRVPRSQACH